MRSWSGQGISEKPLNVRELKERAHNLLRKGKIEQACEAYRRLIAEDRKDPTLRMRHAELCVKLGRPDAAIASYRVAADLLNRAGYAARARAALHVALQLDPNDAGLLQALYELVRDEAQENFIAPPQRKGPRAQEGPDTEDEILESGFLEVSGDEDDTSRRETELALPSAPGADSETTDPFVPLFEFGDGCEPPTLRPRKSEPVSRAPAARPTRAAASKQQPRSRSGGRRRR